MPYLKVNRDTIHFTASQAQKGGPTLLAVHGSGGDYRHWPDSYRNWEAVPAVAVDMPGHGRSAGKGFQQVDDFADFIEAFVLRASLEKVIIIGHSLGGAVAQRLALRSPVWLSGCVLVGTGARLKVSPDIINALVQDYKAAVDLMADWSFSKEADPALIGLFKNGLHNTEPETVIDDLGACHQFDIMNEVSQIRIPALVICGSADRLTPVKYGEYLAEKIPGAALKIIEKAGHMMALEKPQEFMSVLEDFLRSRFGMEKYSF
jgi:pimeloyl-ACP methyl ester carboxylesterase